MPELDWHVQTDVLIAEDGSEIGRVIEMTDERYYAHAYDPQKQEWIRGGCFGDPVVAQKWVEQISGVRPRKHRERRTGEKDKGR
jgi:hypothetical protein